MNVSSPATSAAPTFADWRALAALAPATVISRLVYMPRGVMGFDGPDYINALNLDATFSVPMPGNIGYVLMAKVFTLLGMGPVWAYGMVGTLLSAAAAAFIYLFATLVFSRGLALATAAAVMTNAMVWYHGVIMQSYVVWLATLPAIAYFGLRLVRERTWAMVVAASVATGLSTILRPDLVLFGGPLLGAALLLAWHRDGWSRRGVAWFAAAAAVCAVCCCAWFFGTAAIVGGVDKYLAMNRGKHEWHERFGVGAKGLVEGLARNGVKYALFMAWGAHLALGLGLVGAIVYLRSARTRWRAWLLAAAWVAPSLYFSWIIFMGNAGLVFPATPLVYLAAAAGAAAMFGPRRAVYVMAALACINAAQFTLTPILRLSDQRAALVNHMFFGYSGRGLRRMYTYQLEDFGIDRSLKNTVRQFRDPQPLPRGGESDTPPR